MRRSGVVGGTFRAPVLAAVLAVGTGCSSADSPVPSGAWDGVVDTLESGRIVVRNGGTPLWENGEAWTAVEAVRIGSLEGDSPDVFGQVWSVELDAEGRVYVLDSQASEVRVFAPDGGYLRTLGRPGEGPGELAGPVGFDWGPGGALWVMDSQNARYTAFDPETGEVVAEESRAVGFFQIPWPGGFDEPGHLWDTGLARIEGTPGVVSLIRLDSLFRPADTLRLPQGEESSRILFTRDDGAAVMTMQDPFAPRPVWSLWPRGGVTVFDGLEYELQRVARGGDTVRTIVLDRPRAPVTPAERDSALSAFAETARAMAGDATPEREPRVPDRKPAVRSLFEDDRGHLWVEPYREAGAPVAYDVFDRGGRYLGSVEMPPEVAPGAAAVVRGERLALIMRGELDAPVVAVFEIVER